MSKRKKQEADDLPPQPQPPTALCCAPSSWRAEETRPNNGSPPLSSSTEGDRLLVQDMNNLSVQERQKIYEEIHGVVEMVDETPAFVQDCLRNLQTKLDRILRQKNKRVAAMKRAAFLMPRRVHNDDFQLHFLRCEDYNAEKAVQRMVAYFDFCLQYFGIDGILRDITIKDLNEDDMEYLKTGTMQPVLNMKDQSGRPVVIFFNSLSRAKHVDNMARGTAVATMEIFKNPIAARRGAVLVSWNTEPPSDYVPPVTPAFLRMATSYFHSVPMKFSAIHFCYNDPSMFPMLETVKLASSTNHRVRFRTHFGSALECKYALMTFGIDASRLPLTADNDLDRSNLTQWIASIQEESRCKDDDASSKDNQSFIVPTSKDILLGRGIPFREFPGNIRFATLMDQWWDTYKALPRLEKIALARRLAQSLSESGCRFLKRSSPTHPWLLVPMEEAVDKVSHSFRNKPLLEKYHQKQRQQGGASEHISNANVPLSEGIDGSASEGGGADAPSTLPL